MGQWNRENPLYETVRGRSDGGYADNRWRTPMQMEADYAPMTDEQYALLLNGKVAKKTRALRAAADIQRAQEEEAFLNSISSGDTAGVYAAPTDERGARLQELMNRDYVARARGSALSMAGMRRNEAQERADRPFNLALANFRAGRGDEAFQRANINRNFATGRADEANQRDFQERQFADRQLLQEAQAGRANLETALRERRLDQQIARDTAVGNRFETRQTSQDQQRAFAQAMAMGQDGIPLRDVEAAFGNELSEPQRALLRQYDAQARAQGRLAESVARSYTERLRGVPTEDVTTESPGMFANAFRSILPGRRTRPAQPTTTRIPRPPEDIARDREQIEFDRNRDRQARDMIVFDPDSNSYRPIPRYAGMSGAGASTGAPTTAPRSSIGDLQNVPENLRGQYREGQRRPGLDEAGRADGTIWQFRNGQFVRIR